MTRPAPRPRRHIRAHLLRAGHRSGRPVAFPKEIWLDRLGICSAGSPQALGRREPRLRAWTAARVADHPASACQLGRPARKQQWRSARFHRTVTVGPPGVVPLTGQVSHSVR
jgi:hypothetical protein